MSIVYRTHSRVYKTQGLLFKSHIRVQGTQKCLQHIVDSVGYKENPQRHRLSRAKSTVSRTIVESTVHRSDSTKLTAESPIHRAEHTRNRVRPPGHTVVYNAHSRLYRKCSRIYIAQSKPYTTPTYILDIMHCLEYTDVCLKGTEQNLLCIQQSL